jgi:hypothetical protein
VPPPEIVESALEIAQEGVRPAEHPRPGERLAPAQRTQMPPPVLVVARDALLDRLAGLMRDGRERCGR